MSQNDEVPSARVATFLYHEVTDDPSSTGFQRKSALPYKHGTVEFRDHMACLAGSPLNPSLVHEVDFGSRQRYLLLTFDDGGRSALHIADELEERGWRGHFFVTTSLIGSDTFLSADGVRELHHRGHVVGSHSHSHPDVFYELEYEEMLHEWRTSRKILAEILRRDVDCASIPGGEMDRDTQLSAREAGFRFLFTSEPVLEPWRIDSLICLGRVCPKHGSPLRKVSALARQRGFWKANLVRRVKSSLKRVYYPARRLLRNKLSR